MISDEVNGVTFGVFVFLFLLVTILGFAASHSRRAKTLDNLDEWGLGGRPFGTQDFHVDAVDADVEEVREPGAAVHA